MCGDCVMIWEWLILCGFYPIEDMWELGLLEGRDGCKLWGNVGYELSENLFPFLTA